MSEPIGNTEQLPVAYMSIFETDNAHDKFRFMQSDWYPTPVYTHPVAEKSSLSELTDEKIMDCWENEVNKWQEIENYDIYNFARAIIKASRGEK